MAIIVFCFVLHSNFEIFCLLFSGIISNLTCVSKPILFAFWYSQWSHLNVTGFSETLVDSTEASEILDRLLQLFHQE